MKLGGRHAFVGEVPPLVEDCCEEVLAALIVAKPLKELDRLERRAEEVPRCVTVEGAAFESRMLAAPVNQE